MHQIPTYIINLKKRQDRRAHVLQEFKNKEEFKVKVIEAIENESGALGLWETIKRIVKECVEQNEEFVLLCEDDHQFTASYDKKVLTDAIKYCQILNADALMGGVSWFVDALAIGKGLFWVDKFTGTQFIVIFKKFYEAILNAQFQSSDTADSKIYELSSNKFLIYPFLSTQKEFGYSDATPFNNDKEGYVTQIFENSARVLSHIVKANKFYFTKIEQ